MKDTGEMRNLEEKERIAESAGSSVPAGSEKKGGYRRGGRGFDRGERR